MVESLGKEILAERLTKFYQELKQDDGKEYSRSAHVAIKATLGIKCSEFGQVGLSLRSAVSTISIIKSKMAPTRSKEYRMFRSIFFILSVGLKTYYLEILS